MLFSVDELMMTLQKKVLIQQVRHLWEYLSSSIPRFRLYKACRVCSCRTCSLSLSLARTIVQVGAETREAQVFATCGRDMESASYGAAFRIPIGSSTYPAKEVTAKPICDAVSSRIVSTSYGSSQLKQKRAGAVIRWMNKFRKKADSYVQSIREHVRFGPKLADKAKGKLNLGERILQAGGVEGAYAQIFGAGEEEKLLKALHCCLSTTAGPIAGMLFISTEKIAFHSDKSLTVTSPKGEVIRIPYKVMIPLRKVKKANLSENLSKPLHKYIQITTVDNFEFWFMGFASYNRSFKDVHKARCFAQ